MREFLEAVFADNLAEHDGIFMADPLSTEESVFVGKQFLEDAQTYHAKYFNVPHFVDLLATGLEGIRFDSHPRILDLGSGSGNSVLAALHLFPQAEIVATDISANLLRILRRMLPQPSQVALVCSGAESLNLRPRSVDLIIGTAILHHLLNPERVIRTLVPAVKPGGILVFCEAFEMGYDILALAYRRILYESPLGPTAHEFLSGQVKCFEAMRGLAEKEYTRFLDDKWLFTHNFFRELSRSLGLGLSIRGLHDRERPFTAEALSHARLGGFALPNSALNILAEYDSSFSSELKEDLIFVGIVTLRVPAPVLARQEADRPHARVEAAELEARRAREAAEQAEAKLVELLERHETLRRSFEEAQADLVGTRADVARLEQTLGGVLASRSWRLTKPLREAKCHLRKMFLGFRRQ